MRCILILHGLIVIASALPSLADEPATLGGDEMISKYFTHETQRVSDACLADIASLDQWQARREQYRSELLEMLGLQPLPRKTDLCAEVTGTVEHDGFIVENLHFQSRPGLYVTANLYRPQTVTRPLPAILYVCGHGAVKKNGRSFGNKVHYQHHGSWFARNGYVCLVIDTLQLGEIEGIHHGTYRYDRWWWLNRGYTPAGVEAWNCVRALDYLETREEVDGRRIGVTGRSGGGAYSWWIAAIDERVRCAVPVAGITDLHNHVVDGTVEGHCDCMFMVNTYRWDYAQVAAMVAPRPLLISNTDTDRIFPLDGVYRTFQRARRIYELYGATNDIALNITAGGHNDTQELRVHAFRWFNHHLKGDDSLVTTQAEKYFEPEQLQVLQEAPSDQANTTIDERFVQSPEPSLPADKEAWDQQRRTWMDQLREKCFRGWPTKTSDLAMEEVYSRTSQGVRLRAYDFTSQQHIRLRLYFAHRDGLKHSELIVLNTQDEPRWAEFRKTYVGAFPDAFDGKVPIESNPEDFSATKKMFASFPWAMAYVAPRGIGPTAWNRSRQKQIQNRRRFYLLGQSLHGMQAYDIRRSIQAVRSLDAYHDVPLWLQSHGVMAGATIYASLFEMPVRRLDLYELPETHRAGPYLLNVRRILDMPQAVSLAAERSQIVIYDDEMENWDYPLQVARQLQWDEKQIQIRKRPDVD